MNVKPLHPNFQMPVRSSELAGGYDLFMPDGGLVPPARGVVDKIPLGFAAEVPEGHVALMLPRSSAGKLGISLRNTCGVIDADYRGEWMVMLYSLGVSGYRFKAGERLVQFLIVPVATPGLMEVAELNETVRGEGGFGSTGSGPA